MAIQELSNKEIEVVSGGLTLKLNLLGTVGKLLKNVLTVVGKVLKKLGL